YGICVGNMLASVSAPDAKTVEFRLKQRDATFLTTILPDVMIESRAAIEAAYAPFAERRPTLDAAVYRTAVGQIDAQLRASEPDGQTAREGTDELFAAAGLEGYPRDQFVQPDGRFDTCLYAQSIQPLLAGIAASLDATGLDAITLAYPALPSSRAPIGTGP